MKQKIAWGVIGLAFVLVGGFIYKDATTPGQYDNLARCLKDKGAIFYGAFWCPHCQAQKKAFGKSVKLLPYTECSTADGSAQLQICTDAKVESYPTWVFPDGSRLTGEQEPSALAAKLSCPLN